MAASVRRKHIRALVDRLLAKRDIHSAPVAVADLANSLGVEVRFQPAETTLSGFLVRDPNQQHAVIGVNRTHHWKRQRFTIAHELGHFLLHNQERVHVDRTEQGLLVKLRNQNSSTGLDVEEKEANLFAAELLMPMTFLQADLEAYTAIDLLDEEVLKPLADLYQVSTQALTFRLAYLNYVQL
jgi:Zn-dependent peptidase ImmA (M78 family)